MEKTTQLKSEYIDTVLNNPSIIGDITARMLRKTSVTVERWFKTKNHEFLCNINVLSVISEHLQVPIEELTEEVPVSYTEL